MLSVPAGNFAPQLKIGETKSKLGQIRSGLSHYIDGNHYIALIILNTTVILKKGLSIPIRSGSKLPDHLKIIVVVVICSPMCQKS